MWQAQGAYIATYVHMYVRMCNETKYTSISS